MNEGRKIIAPHFGSDVPSSSADWIYLPASPEQNHSLQSFT